MLYLQDMMKLGQQTQLVNITERLPSYIIGPCQLNVSCSVKAEEAYYLINMETAGDLTIICQRCAQEFIHPYSNQLTLALCKNEKRAEQLLGQYETIVAPELKIDLVDLVNDELHLYAPQFHLELKDCDSKVIKILEGN